MAETSSSLSSPFRIKVSGQKEDVFKITETYNRVSFDSVLLQVGAMAPGSLWSLVTSLNLKEEAVIVLTRSGLLLSCFPSQIISPLPLPPAYLRF